MKTSFTIRRILLFSMALCLTMIGMAQTQEVTIGGLQGRVSSPPSDIWWRWSYSQQLFYADEIGTDGLITSISFYKKNIPSYNPYEVTRSVSVFMKLTDQMEFSSSSDWINVSPDDLVFDGDYVVPEDSACWVTIQLDTPFYFDGTSNLMVGFHDKTGVSNNRFFGYAVNGYSSSNYNDGFDHRVILYEMSNPTYEPDPYNPSAFYHGGEKIGYARNSVKVVINSASSPVVEVLPDSIGFGDTPNNAWKHPQEIVVKNSGLSGVLDAVEVTGNYFSLEGPTTPLDMPFGAQFDYSLSHGNAEGFVNETLNVVYSDEGREVLAVPVTAFAYDPVCPDVFELAQVVNTYPYSDTPEQIHNVYQLPGENEDGPDAVYKMTFANDVMLNANVVNGENSKIALYKEDFDGGGGPHIDNAYEGPKQPAAPEPISEWLYYDDGYYQTNVGNGGIPVSWGVMFPAEQLVSFDGCVLDKVRIYDATSGEASLKIYIGGENAPGQLVSKQSFQLSGNVVNHSFLTVVLDTPVLLDVTKNLWICFHSEDISHPAAACNYCGDPNSCWYSTDDESWAPVYEFNSELFCSWMVRAFVTNENGSRELRAEGEITNMTVEAGTYYLVASSTDEGFSVNINAEDIPLPEAANNPTPANNAASIVDPLRLQWNFGDYTTSYRLLFGTSNPPTEVVVDWSNELSNEYLTGLLNNNMRYFWRVDEQNSSGITQGPVWSFTTTLDKPQNLAADNTAIYVGDTVTLTWDEHANRLFQSYNVYQNNVLIGNTASLEYQVTGLAYNMTGYQFAVTAVYDEGESPQTEAVVVKVTGEGSVSGAVVEQDMTTPIAGVLVKLSGYDEHGAPQLYEFVTDENGQYGGNLLAGTYTAIATREGYQIKVLSSSVTVQYQTETGNVNFMMDEVYASVGEVTAVDLDNEARISWNNEMPPQEPEWIYYDNGYFSGALGAGASSLYWGIDFPDMTEYAGMQLTKVSYYDHFEGNIVINIYLGGTTAPVRLVSSQGFTATYADKFIEIDLAVPVEIDGTEPLWITCYCENATYWPATACPNMGNPHGRWLSHDGTVWVDAMYYSYEYTWMLRGYLEDANGSGRSLQHYNVYRSDCYDDSTVELVATNVTDTVYRDLAWNDLETGVYKWGVSKTYQGNRDSREMSTLLSEGFEGVAMPDGWSQYGGDWDWAFTNRFAENINIGPHGGNYAAYCNSDGESGTRNLVTPPIDLSTATAASLSFYYVLPDWAGDWDDLYVKYSTSSTGPWTTLWTAPSDTWSWTEKTIDLSELCGGVYYFDFSENDWWGYGAAIDDVTISADVYTPNLPHESAIVWSNCLDKDMLTTVDLKVITNNTESPEGTQISFISISEPDLGHDVELTIDETGQYVWNDFRKGAYRYTIKKHGYASCADLDTIEIWEPSSVECLLEEILHPVEDLYVSPTGWATWSGGYLTHGDAFYYDFEDGTMGDWTLIDADGDGYDWKLGVSGGNPSIAGHQSPYCVYSESYDPALGGLYPDNYLISPRVSISENSVLSFYACAQDEWYNDHYGVAISTLGNTTPDEFVTIWEETVPSNPSKGNAGDPKGSRIQGDWYYREIDLSAYAGQQVYIAFRHFNTYDMFCIDIDDIRLADSRDAKTPTGYKVKLNNVWTADPSTTYYQHDENTLVPGQRYLTQVAPVYATGMGDWMSYEWTYVPCEEFAGADQLTIETTEDAVLLNWNLPEIERRENSRDGQWYYYDDGVWVDNIGTNSGQSIYWAVMFPAGSYVGNKISKVAMYDKEGGEHQGRVMIYQGGDTAPRQLIYTRNYETFGVNDFVEFEFSTPVDIDPSQNLWIVMNNTTGTLVASACNPSPDPNSGWISLDGMEWHDIVDYGFYCSWMLRAYLLNTNVDGILGTMVWRDGELITETPVEGEHFTDAGVPEGGHEYCIRVVHDGMPDSTYYAMSCPLCEQVEVLGIGEHNELGSTVYPNPTTGEVTIQATGMSHVRIVNVLGQVVHDCDVKEDELLLNMAVFGKGVYVIHITTSKGTVVHRLVVS